MFQRKYFSRWTIVTTALILLSGCATTSRSYYPDFPSKSSDLKGIDVLVDLSVLEDVQGVSDQFDSDLNLEYGEIIRKTLTDALTAKGYAVAKSSITSFGLSLDSDEKKFHAIRADDPAEKYYDRKIYPPPYYVDGSFEPDEKNLQKLYRALKLAKIKKQKTLKIQDAKFLDKGDGHVALIVLGQGRIVPTGEQIMQAIGTTAMTFGLVSAWQSEYMHLSFYLIETDTGEILISDKAGLSFGFDRERIRSMVEKMAKRFPGKGQPFDEN